MNGNYKRSLIRRGQGDSTLNYFRGSGTGSTDKNCQENMAYRMIKLVIGSVICLLFATYEHLLLHFRRKFRAVQKYQPVRYDLISPSPLTQHRLSVVKRKIMVLDLDETLIHSHHDGLLRPTVKPGTPPDFVLKVMIDQTPVRFFVHLRPHVEFFLSVVSQWFDLVIFTASMEIYGSSVADKLDKGRGILQRRYFRQHCTQDYNGYTKDLSAVDQDLSSIFILDNSPSAYRNYMQNAIPIKSWFSDPHDTCLLQILPFLDALRFTSDVRSILGRISHRVHPAFFSSPLMSSSQSYSPIARETVAVPYSPSQNGTNGYTGGSESSQEYSPYIASVAYSPISRSP